MRTTVGEMVSELQKLDQKAALKFQLGTFSPDGRTVRNGVQRVDSFIGEVVIVLDTLNTALGSNGEFLIDSVSFVR